MSKKRKSGTGLVRLRSDGRWEGRHVIGYDEKGLPKTKSVLAKTKKECVAKLKALQETCQSPQPQRQKKDMKFGDWIAFWYEHYCKATLRPKTQGDYENRIFIHIIPALGHVPLNKLTTRDLQQFYVQLKTNGRKTMVEYYGAGLSDRVVHGCHVTCMAALERAVSDKLLSVNPAKGCKVASAKAPEMQVLIQEEMRRFLIQAKEEGYYEVFLLALATGLRRGELLALQWEDLDVATGALQVNRQVHRINGELTIAPPKTNASIRTIILPPSVVAVLEFHRTHTQGRWMFPSPKKEDSPLDPATARKRLQTILQHAQCKQVRFHDLRHTFATNAIASGVDVKTLSTLIGHISTNTTLNTYAHSTETMQREAAQRIDKGMGNQVATVDTTEKEPPQPAQFTPYKSKIRKAGTGCISQISEYLWEGRYSPRWLDGKREARNIYAKTEAECEEKLKTLIVEMKTELAELKSASQ